jgi:phospholipid/cholesterol/gamma-HCH transport system substrate-binding protein
MTRLLVVIGGVALAVLAVLLLQSGPSPYVVRATFADAEGLRPQFSVREQGVVVGSVAQVALTRADKAVVTVDLDRSAAPIGAGASASIDPSNLLGEKYVEIDPGNVDRPQPSGSLIPIARTSEAPELDQVLDAFDPDTRQATALFLAEEGDALVGRGASLASVLSDLPPSLHSTQQLLSGLASDNAALGRLIDQSDQILTASVPQRAALGRLVSRADGAFDTLAGRQRALAQTINRAPGTLAQLRTSLVILQRTAGPLAAAATGLRVTAPSLTSTLRAIPAFAGAAIPTLRTALRAAPSIDRLATQAPPIVAALDPTASRLATFASYLAPVSKLLDEDIGPILDVVQGWARAISDRDGIGHIYRVEALLPTNTLNAILGAVGISASLRRQYGLLASQPTKRHGMVVPRQAPRTVRSLRSTRSLPSAPAPTSRATTPVMRPPVLRIPPAPGTGAGGAPTAASTVSSLLHYLLSK